MYFDAIAECVQYIEDLFALIKASKNPDFFIKNIITYKAGEITNYIKSFSSSSKSIAESFHFIHEPEFSDHVKAGYTEGVNNLIEIINDLVKFYKDYEFFYLQYKHGLTVAMRPLGNLYSDEVIEKEKNGELDPYLAVYDNRNLHLASKKGTFSTKRGVLMPGFTEDVRKVIGELSQEDNYLRLVFPPDINFSMDMLIDIARKTKTCLHTFIVNYSNKISHEEGFIDFHLPSDYKTNVYYNFNQKGQ